MYVLVGILQSVGMYYIYYNTPGGNSGRSSHGQSKKLLFDSWAKIGRRTSIMVFSVSFNIFLLQLKITACKKTSL
jgi:hypothetical protein